MTNNQALKNLGYNKSTESDIKALELEDSSVARVVAEHRGMYGVKGVSGKYLAKITGKQVFSATERDDYPAVGDWVAITMLDKEKVVIDKILPRKTILRKKHNNKQEGQIIATNVDAAFIVESVGENYSLNRFERYVVLAQEGSIRPIIVLNKTDLISETELKLKIREAKTRFNDIDIVSTSTVTKQGLENLMNHIKTGETYCFLGSSGVGKSSLINGLLEENTIDTGEVNSFTGKGKHTTTGRKMYFLKNGGILIDNPGMRGIGMVSMNMDGVFEEIADLSKKCKYSDCAHEKEPGCAVLAAVEAGELDKKKFNNYIKLKKETEYYEMTKLKKRTKDKQFGKFIKKAKKQLIKDNY
jgi:ribosome biogenesis GTPase / thiamine phosphate phosphatase